MTYADWCAQPRADGHHRLDALPLPTLHPLGHGQFAVDITVADGRIMSCAFDFAGSHRGDEKLLEVRDFKQGLALANRHSWLSAAFAETLYARIIETALGLVISPRAEGLRNLVLALNAEATTVYWQAVEAALTGGTPDLSERERILAVLERITGARIHPTYVRVGGVAADVDAADLAAVYALGKPVVTACAEALETLTGEIDVMLPKVLRLPNGEYFDEIATPHGISAMWVFGRGDKVPHRVHLRPGALRALATLERRAVGMSVPDFLWDLATTRLVLGEVAR